MCVLQCSSHKVPVGEIRKGNLCNMVARVAFYKNLGLECRSQWLYETRHFLLAGGIGRGRSHDLCFANDQSIINQK